LSKTNVELLQRAYDAFARGDIGSVLDVMTDDVQFVVAENSPYYRGTPYVGKQEIGEKLFARVPEEWDGYRIEVERLQDAGEVAIARIRYRGTYKATGRTMAAQAVHIWTMRDGKLAKLEQYADTAAMRDVLGSPAASAQTA
jgi:ketosteroid isomerase-like protein